MPFMVPDNESLASKYQFIGTIYMLMGALVL